MVNVRPTNRLVDELHESPVKEKLKGQNVMLETNNGSVTHEFEIEGIAVICLRSTQASDKNPIRFGIQVEEAIESSAFAAELAGGKMGGDNADVDSHLSHMELEMKRIQLGIKNIVQSANQAKDLDGSFHKQFEQMHKAATWWPIVQVCVLLMTGVTQASHIVRFFQSRRII